MTRTIRRPILLTIIVMLGTISVIAGLGLVRQGAFRDLDPAPLSCTLPVAVPGVEDFAPGCEGELYLASWNRAAQIYDQRLDRGEIYRLDLTTGETKPLAHDLEGDFFPRSIAYDREADAVILWVINYRRDGFAIEKFREREGQLHHLQTLTSDALNFPKSVAPVGNGRFYVINERGLYTPTGHFLEEVLDLATSEVWYFDGTRFGEAPVIKDLSHGSGIAWDPEAGTLAIAELRAQRISLWQAGNPPRRLAEKALPTHINNLIRAWDGTLYITGHPQLPAFKSHALDPRAVLAPSEVWKVHWHEAKAELMSERLVLDLGKPVPGATAAIAYEDHLWLAGPFAEGVGRCALTTPRHAAAAR